MRTISENPAAYTPPIFTQWELDTLREIRRVFAALPEQLDLGCKPNGEPIAVYCHMLARGFGAAFPDLAVCDGRVRSATSQPQREFACLRDYQQTALGRDTGWKHSWLMTPQKNVIDVVPMAVASDGGPILVAYGWMNAFSGMYNPEWTGRQEDGCYGYFEEFLCPWFWHANDLVAQAVLRARDELDLYP